ncbi:MAG: family 16 glycoside hydrolase [Planctomycetota bacterium]|jgi:arylsulfatase A-like enzyme
MTWTSLLRRSPLTASAAGAVLLATAAFLSPASATGAAGCQKGEEEAGFVSLLNGTNLDGWQLRRAERKGFVVEDGLLVCPAGSGGYLFTKKEYADFVLRFEFRMEEGANSGVAIRSPLVDRKPAYQGIEIQILDNPRFAGKLRPTQYHGSIYDVIPAKLGALKPVGQWNEQEIVCKGRQITVKVNGQIVVDANLDDVKDAAVLEEHPGLQSASGYIGFLGHGDRVEFRHVRIKNLGESQEKADDARTARSQTRRPNILWLIADNIGPDLGCYGTPLVQTPHLNRLAAEGMRYTRAFSTAPICAPSRSAFMTGMYATTIDAQHMRSHRHDHFHLPEGVRPITHRLIEAGYYTANIRMLDGLPSVGHPNAPPNGRVGTCKIDLNFKVEGPVLRRTAADERRRREAQKAPEGGTVDSRVQDIENEIRLFHTDDWADLKEHQPFFAQVNFPIAERPGRERGPGSGWVGSKHAPAFGTQVHPAVVDPNRVTLPPYYPDHPVARQDWAGYLDCICGLDQRVGEILNRLEADRLADDTIVVFFADQGRIEIRGIGWCYDRGNHVPLIIRWPKNFAPPPGYARGRVNEQLVSLLDFSATTVAFAGLKKPTAMQSRVFLGPGADPPRRYVFTHRDRHDEVVQRIRSVRTDRYRYVRNFIPEAPVSLLPRPQRGDVSRDSAAARAAQGRQAERGAGGAFGPAHAGRGALRPGKRPLRDQQSGRLG